MEPTKELVKSALEKTNAHGMARLVNEKRLYIRVLWLLVWMACCGAFIVQFIGFATKLRENVVTTNFQANAVPFQYPDLYLCFDSPVSGSRPLVVKDSAAELINASFKRTSMKMDELCKELTENECLYMQAIELPIMSINTLPYHFVTNQLAHTMEQSILNSYFMHSNGMIHKSQKLNIKEAYHPSGLRCFQMALNDTERSEFTGSNKAVYFLLMLDAADSRMGKAALPIFETPVGNISASYWALDKDTLYWPDRWSAATLYITEPGHYPSRFQTSITLEAGRTYNVELGMKEELHTEDPSRCVDQHPDVQIVNPYDHSPYTVAYDYAYCYNSAVQAQLKRELNATCAFLPHPWPPAERTLYNLSSGWGSVQDVRNFLTGRERLDPDEPMKKCETAHKCSELTYTTAVKSVVWPSPDSLKTLLRELDFPEDSELQEVPAMHYLKRLVADSNTSELAAEFVRANFLQLQLIVKSPTGDRTIFTRAYSFESFVADIGGILGLYLGMSVMTAFEIMQFLHDMVLLCIANNRRKQEPSESKTRIDQGAVSLEETEFQF